MSNMNHIAAAVGESAVGWAGTPCNFISYQLHDIMQLCNLLIDLSSQKDDPVDSEHVSVLADNILKKAEVIHAAYEADAGKLAEHDQA